MKKILVLGGTGAMGRYLVPELLSLGYSVDVACLDEQKSDNPRLQYVTGNVKENGVLEKFLKNSYDGIVDFMTWKTAEFERIYKLFLDNTKHYIYLSSCRVFADAPPITENSPMLLDVSEDKEFLATDDYAFYKVREERMLINSGYKNFTIVRPATTYSTGRFQLIYARFFNRITDNTKILEATGMKQEEVMTLKDGLKYEFERSKDFDWAKYEASDRNVRMDKYLKNYEG